MNETRTFMNAIAKQVSRGEALRRWKKLAKTRARLLAKSEEKITRILCDVKYKGGVQFWIQKHDALLLRYQRLLLLSRAKF